MDRYTYTESSRNVGALLITLFVLVFFAAFINSRFWLFQLTGIFLGLLLLNCICGLLKDETWTLTIAKGKLSWEYPKGDQPHGEISLADVQCLIVDDTTGYLEIRLRSGGTQTIRFIGKGSALHTHVQQNYPHIDLSLRQVEE